MAALVALGVVALAAYRWRQPRRKTVRPVVQAQRLELLRLRAALAAMQGPMVIDDDATNAEIDTAIDPAIDTAIDTTNEPTYWRIRCVPRPCCCAGGTGVLRFVLRSVCRWVRFLYLLALTSVGMVIIALVTQQILIWTGSERTIQGVWRERMEARMRQQNPNQHEVASFFAAEHSKMKTAP